MTDESSLAVTGVLRSRSAVFSDTPLKVMTYNVRDGELSVGGYDQAVTDRKVGLAKTIALKNPEIVCLQECDDLSASSLASSCASNGTRTYTVYQPSGKTSAVLYDANLFTRLSNGYVDITVPEADGGDGYQRAGVWVKLKRKEDNVIFYVVSTHFDLKTPQTSAETLYNYISANFGNYPVIIGGDLNANEARWVNIGWFKGRGFTNANTAYVNFLKDNHITGGNAGWNDRVSGSAADNGLAATFPKDGTIIDWIYFNSAILSVTDYQVVTTKVKWTYSSYQTIWQDKSITDIPSDHYPVYVELTFGV